MTLHINWGPTMHVHKREREQPRWCFGCRKRLGGDHVLWVTDDPMSYYGPHWSYECDGCKQDRRWFPGCEPD